MAAKLWQVSQNNAFNSTLNGSIGSGDATITLNSVIGLQAPGVVTIDRTDGSGNATPSTREYVSFTGISGSQLTGCTRGLGGSTGQAHNSGALVEECWSITHWNDAVSFMSAEHDSVGHHVIGTATVNYVEAIQMVATSIASIAWLAVGKVLSASGASVTGNITSLTGTQTITNKTIANPIAIYEFSNQTLPSVATINWMNGDRQSGLIISNVTLAMASPASGQVLSFWAYQNATGGFSLSFNPTPKWPSATPPVFGGSASQVNAVIIRYDGVNFFGQSATSFG